MEYRIEIKPKFEDLFKKLGKDAGEGRAVAFQNVLLAVEAKTAETEAPHAKTSNLTNGIHNFLLGPGRGGVMATAKDKRGHDYASDVHDGTRPHEIRPKNARALFWPGASYPVMVVHHPGFKGRPFFDISVKKLKVESIYDQGLQNFLRMRGW